MKWKISLSEAHAAIHSGGILHGEVFMWPQAELSRIGRQLLKAKEIRDQWKREGLAPFLDFDNQG